MHWWHKNKNKHDLIIIYLALKVVCAMHMLYKTGTFCLRVADPHFIFYRIGVCTIRTHMCCLLPADLALALNQVSSFCPIPILPTLFSGGNMWRNYTYGSTRPNRGLSSSKFLSSESTIFLLLPSALRIMDLS